MKSEYQVNNINSNFQDHLPITGFVYGFMTNFSKASVTIGPLECKGKKKELKPQIDLNSLMGGQRSGGKASWYLPTKRLEPCPYPSWINDGQCDESIRYDEACNFDGNDCN